MAKLCIIPARGGSKRIPRKNIKSFLGKPIIAYSIQAALESKDFDKVIVSTDDNEIAEVAKKYGAEVPFLRSKKNSNDYATIADVMFEVIDFFEKEKINFDEIACLFATAPFISAKKIIEANAKLKEGRHDSVFFIQEFGYPIFRSLKKNENENLEMFWPENLNTRSQDLPKAFHDAGQYYIAKTKAFIEQKTFFTKASGGILVSDLEARDIDSEMDWQIAETIYRLQIQA